MERLAPNGQEDSAQGFNRFQPWEGVPIRRRALKGAQERIILRGLVVRRSVLELVHRVISRRHTAVGQLADFQGANDEHI